MYPRGCHKSAIRSAGDRLPLRRRRRHLRQPHTIYKNGAKEIADQHGKSLTFMAKFDEREGNSRHIHIRYGGTDGSPVFADSADPPGMSPMFRSFSPARSPPRELPPCYAPNINSYKRFAAEVSAPTAVALGDGQPDPSTGWWATVTHADGEPAPAATSTSTWRCRADRRRAARDRPGTSNRLDPVVGNAHVGDAQRLPTTLAEAAELFGHSAGGPRRSAATRSSSTPTTPGREIRPSTRRGQMTDQFAALSGSDATTMAAPVIGSTTYRQPARSGVRGGSRQFPCRLPTSGASPRRRWCCPAAATTGGRRHRRRGGLPARRTDPHRRTDVNPEAYGHEPHLRPEQPGPETRRLGVRSGRRTAPTCSGALGICRGPRSSTSRSAGPAPAPA